jgi:membrane-bound ClpP family serine protease
MKLSEVTYEQARKTCLVVAVVLFLIGSWSFYREKITNAEIFGASGLVLILCGFFLPAVSKRFHVVWMTIAFALGYVNSRIILTIIFFLMFVPYHLFSMLFGRDPLNRRSKKLESYWIPKKNTRQRKEQFERLF